MDGPYGPHEALGSLQIDVAPPHQISQCLLLNHNQLLPLLCTTVVVPKLFDAFLSLLILELFIPSQGNLHSSLVQVRRHKSGTQAICCQIMALQIVNKKCDSPLNN